MATPDVTSNAPPQSIINALQSDLGSRLPDVWHTASQAPLVRTFRFETSQPGDLHATYSGWTAFSGAEKQIARAVLDEFAAITNVRFVETGSSDADLSLGRVAMSAGLGGEGGYSSSYSYNSSGITSKSFDSFAVVNKTLSLGSISGRSTLIHEIGHALMLKHPGPYGGGQAPYLPTAVDNNKYTVMSYHENPDNGSDSDHLMLYDIAALQARFGANLSYRTGDDTYRGPDGLIQAIWDAGGTDRVDGSRYAKPITIDLIDGHFSSLGARNNFAIAFGTVIENATGGTGSDTILGNAWANRLAGGAGQDRISGGGRGDTIDGGEGGDRLDGGSGNDRLTGGDGGDRFVFSTALRKNVDTITDFGGGDSIFLDHAVFKALSPTSELRAGAFFAGAAAHDASDRILYDSATGHLLYDSDGNGDGHATVIARLAAGLSLSNGDFVVF